jgi:hypothetical protein
MMAEKQAFSGPLDESRLRLEAWCRHALQRLSPLAGEDGARKLIDALVSERLGRRIDQIAPEGFLNGLGPDYREIRDFFARFAPDVASYLPPRRVTPGSMDRLRRIQMAMCGRLVSDHPETLGRSGKTLLSREWKEIESELPRLEEAIAKLASAPEGEAAQAECRAELEAILSELLDRLDDPKALLELRRALRRSLDRPARKPDGGGRGRGPRTDH